MKIYQNLAELDFTNSKPLDRILKGEHISDNSLSGVGVKNVDERIKLYFSKYSGLYFRSNYGHGTVACIYIYDKKQLKICAKTQKIQSHNFTTLLQMRVLTV